MGNGMVQEAVEDAASDMGNVQAAADAISAAIAKVTPWLSGETWTGSAATSWEGDWNTFYATVKSCLNDLPAAGFALYLERLHVAQAAEQALGERGED